jgi:ariadne-1
MAYEAAGSASDMDVDAFDTDYKFSGKGKGKLYEVDYDSLSQADIEKAMKEDVENISGIFGVDVSYDTPSHVADSSLPTVIQVDTASLLLRHFDWNKEKLIEKYMDNPAAVNAASGIAVAEKSLESERHVSRSPLTQAPSGVRRSSRQSATEKSKPGKTKSILDRISPPAEERQPFVCPICYDDSQTEYLSLCCEHKFCSGCWNAYIMSKIRSEAEHWITCMAEDCAIVAPNTFVRTSLQDDNATWERFQELLVRHYVSCNHSLKYCPYPSCTYTVSCPTAASKSSLTTIVPIVTCGASSSHKFCFGCNIDDDHRPVVCAVAKLWLQKCQDDSETANWIKSNTKECSKCQSTIEKNGGCKYVFVPRVCHVLFDRHV